ncbi:DNA-binding transcriptional LysR family regulator [Paraburkholderia sp. GAS42]
MQKFVQSHTIIQVRRWVDPSVNRVVGPKSERNQDQRDYCWGSLMDHLDAIKVFVCIADLGGFASAARAMRVSTAVASRHVAFLEQKLHTRLFHRNSRNLSLTDSGQLYLERVRGIVDELDSIEKMVNSANLEPAGELRIVAPVVFGFRALGPVIESYSKRFPKVRTDITLDDRGIDLVEDGFDVGIFAAHEISSRTLIARTLLAGRLIVCATPHYVDTYGAPSCREELSAHQCLVTPSEKTGVAGESAGMQQTAHVKQRNVVVANNIEMLHQLALLHLGVAIFPDYLVNDDIAQNRLVEIPGDFGLCGVEIKVGYASRKHLSAKIRTFVDHAAGHFGGRRENFDQ